MGFKDLLKKGVEGTVEFMNTQAEIVQRYRDKYEHYSDEELIRAYKTTHDKERYAIGLILKDRGFGS